MNTIAVLITCHNRKEKTLKCLTFLFNCILPDGYKFDVFLVDDGSTDGTSDTVKEKFPQVNIIAGNGNLFWNRGMYTAWTYARKKEKYDYYLWLNDDIELYPFCMDELFECYSFGGKDCIISGFVEDSNHRIIYGGFDKQKKMLNVTGKLQPITYMNGNVVLVPYTVVEKIGILDGIFHHDLGDVDYGFRAVESKINVFTTRISIALGCVNNFCRVRKWNSNIIDRFKKLYSPLGSNPMINFYFRKKHFGISDACIYWVYIHIINVLPDTLINIFFGDLYHDK
ncbi:MAG: glycosyltransferase [Bacteroidales bacterium]|jgi:GT2 family glycosyltransferase|nr:glycosyltransferase [Bacteroidales bacterium]